jgi:transmembrane 9 superfamily member 2/4
VIVFVLSAMIAAILVGNLRRDIIQYNHVASNEEIANESQQNGWKSVRADVICPPSFSPLLLATMCGIGAQLLGTTFFTIVFSALGFMSPA